MFKICKISNHKLCEQTQRYAYQLMYHTVNKYTYLLFLFLYKWLNIYFLNIDMDL